MRKKKKSLFTLTLMVIIFILVNSSSIFAESENYKYHMVKTGEWLYQIVRSYGVDEDKIKEIVEFTKEINGLADGKVNPGDRLIIPIKGGIWYEVKEDQSLWRIAQTYGVSEKDIMEINNILDRDKLIVGQKLFIPGAKEVLQIEIPKKVKPDFCWPGEGKIIKYFDKNSSKGIDIAVPGGTTVVASFRGKVSHKGYHSLLGWYLFIYHEDIGFYTCYTHLSPILLAEEGSTVEKGEPIAMVEYPEEGFEV